MLPIVVWGPPDTLLLFLQGTENESEAFHPIFWGLTHRHRPWKTCLDTFAVQKRAHLVFFFTAGVLSCGPTECVSRKPQFSRNKALYLRFRPQVNIGMLFLPRNTDMVTHGHTIRFDAQTLLSHKVQEVGRQRLQKITQCSEGRDSLPVATR